MSKCLLILFLSMVAVAFRPVLFQAGLFISSNPGLSLRLMSGNIPDSIPMGSNCDAASISDLHSGNIYESQVLSTLITLREGLRIEKYPYNAPAEGNAESFDDDFYQRCFLKSLSGPVHYKMKIGEKLKSHKAGDEFECDLYVKLPIHNGPLSVEQLLRLSTESISPLNAHDAADVDVAGKWVLIEISESAQHLPHKLYQLERALHLLPRAASNFAAADVGAVIVLLNGKQEDAEKAISYCTLKPELLISDVPVFVGWVPFRNFLSTISNVNTKVESLIDKVDLMDLKIDLLTQSVAALIEIASQKN